MKATSLGQPFSNVSSRECKVGVKEGKQGGVEEITFSKHSGS